MAVKISYGASGSLLAQLNHGAPFDLFLSADEAYPQILINNRLASDRFEFGLGRLVLWSPQGSFIDIDHVGIQGLLHPSIRKIAIANPAHAPYGAAGISALQYFGIYKKIRKKLVFGEDISQTAHFVESGSAQVGILAYSIVVRKKEKRGGEEHYWLIPSDAHLPLKQVGVIIKKSRQKRLAKTFVRFITMGKGREILQHWTRP